MRALLLARVGRTSEAEAVLRRVDEDLAAAWAADTYSSRLISPPAIHAATLVALGRRDAAIDVLQTAMDRDPETPLYDRCYPELRSLDRDPRYRDLLRRTGVSGR